MWPPALCAQMKSARSAYAARSSATSGGAGRRGAQLVDQAARDAVEERLVRLAVQAHRLAGTQPTHELGAAQLEHVLSAPVGKEVARFLRADEQQLRDAMLRAALRPEFHPRAHGHLLRWLSRERGLHHRLRSRTLVHVRRHRRELEPAYLQFA